jgi:aspartate racemase
MPDLHDPAEPRELALGVLGGMGPEATADFLSKLVAVTPVEREQDHLRVFVDSNPKVLDRHPAIRGEGPSPGPGLADMARGLERIGSGFVVMACNTAHAFEADIRAALTVPFVSMITEAVEGCRVRFPRARRFGLLAAQGCLDARLYQDAFAAVGLETVVPAVDDQGALMELLWRIKRGELSAEVSTAMASLGERLIAAGADVVVAACTEVPLVVADDALSRPLFDPTLHLAQRCVRYARRLEPLPAKTSITR